MRNHESGKRGFRLESLEERTLLAVMSGADSSALNSFSSADPLAAVNPGSIEPSGDGGIVWVTSAADSGEGSLRWAISNVTEGGTIKFDTQAMGGRTVTITSRLQISTNTGSSYVTTQASTFTIDASDVDGGILIDMSGYNSGNGAFYISKSAYNITMTGLTFSGATSTSGSGGAIYNTGTLSLIHCTLTGNTSAGSGGAIHNTGTMSLTGCTLSDNSSTKTTGTDAGGGAISNKGTLVLTDCTLIHNTSALYGAALLFSTNTAGRTLSITNSVFDGNTSASSGGAIYFSTSASSNTLDITNSAFNGNSASSGGAIYFTTSAADKMLNITNTVFNGNCSASSGGGVYVNSGATANNPPLLTVAGCTFLKNDAGGVSGSYGGAIYMYHCSATMTNTLIAENTAYTGAGISVNPRSSSTDSMKLNLINCTIANNGIVSTANGAVAAIQFHEDASSGGNYGTVYLYNTIISESIGNSDVGRYSSTAIHPDVYAYHSIFRYDYTQNTDGNNRTPAEPLLNPDYTLKKGSIAIDAGNNAYVDGDSQFPALSRDIGGNPRIIDASSPVPLVTPNGTVDIGAFEFCELTVTQSTDSGDASVVGTLSWAIANAPLCGGGAVIKFENVNTVTVGDGVTYTITFPVFIDASAVEGGVTIAGSGAGSVFTVGDGDPATLPVSVEMKNLTITGGRASYGGGIMNYDTLTLTDVVFSGNVCARNGGALGNRGGNVIIVGGAFSDNCAVSSTRATNGGAIFNSGTITISGGTVFSGNFISSTAPGNGGAIDNIAGGTINLSGAVFSGNSAAGSNDLVWNGTNDQGCGGAIQNWGTMTVTGCTFGEGNQAYNGGAIANGAGASMQVIGSEFSGNTALFGGAIVNGGTLSVTGASSFTGNVLVIDETTGAAGCGGAIDNLEGGVLTITGEPNALISFSGNTAPTDTEGESDKSMGGAVQNWGDATLTYCVFTGNTAYNGGAIANGPYTAANGTTPAFGAMVLNNVTVGAESNGNTAVYGGGIFNAGDLSLNDVAVSYNTASRNAGGISNATVTLHDRNETASGSLTFTSGSIDITNNYADNCGGGILSSQETEILFGSGFTGTVNATNNRLGDGDGDRGKDERGLDGIFKDFDAEQQSAIRQNFSGGSVLVFYPIAASSPVPLALLIKPVYTTSYVTIDLDGDRFVGPGDYALISAHWFSVAGDDDWNPACDLDGDGFVGPGDLALLSANWFDETETAEVVHRSVIERVFELSEDFDGFDGGRF